MYVSSYLKEHGYPNLIIDDRAYQGNSYTQENTIQSIINIIHNEKPAFVGIPCLVNEINQVVELKDKIKKVSPRTVTLAGGTQAFDTPELFFAKGL